MSAQLTIPVSRALMTNSPHWTLGAVSLVELRNVINALVMKCVDPVRMASPSPLTLNLALTAPWPIVIPVQKTINAIHVKVVSRYQWTDLSVLLVTSLTVLYAATITSARPVKTD